MSKTQLLTQTENPVQTDLVEYADGQMRPAHSSKGASSAERWMNCPGSSALIAAMELPPTDEQSYRAEGTVMHTVAADLLARDEDAWMLAGDEMVTESGTKVIFTSAMADAVQMYLDRVRTSIDRERGFHGEQFFIEAKLAAPDIHEQMFGSVDFGALVKGGQAAEDAHGIMAADGFLDVTDLKGGEGIEVEADDNSQMKYYAFMLIHTKFPELEDDFPVRLTIVQPRCFSVEGPIRDWWTTVGDIKAWVVRDLLPAMHSTDDALSAGDWCRFCPAKLVCPLLAGLFKAAATYDPKAMIQVDSTALGLSYDMLQGVKFYIKALEDEVFRRLKTGTKVPHTKLVNKKANRIWKETVTVQVEGKDTEVPLRSYLKSTWGDKALTEPEVRSPADFENSGVEGAKDFVKQYAFMPITGLTVAREDDKRTGVKVELAADRFAGALANINQGDDT